MFGRSIGQDRYQCFVRFPIVPQKGAPFRFESGAYRASSDEENERVSLCELLIDALTPLLARGEIEGGPHFHIATAQSVFEPGGEFCVLLGKRKEDSHRQLYCRTAEDRGCRACVEISTRKAMLLPKFFSASSSATPSPRSNCSMPFWIAGSVSACSKRSSIS